MFYVGDIRCFQVGRGESSRYTASYYSVRSPENKRHTQVICLEIAYY